VLIHVTSATGRGWSGRKQEPRFCASPPASTQAASVQPLEMSQERRAGFPVEMAKQTEKETG